MPCPGAIVFIFYTLALKISSSVGAILVHIIWKLKNHSCGANKQWKCKSLHEDKSRTCRVMVAKFYMLGLRKIFGLLCEKGPWLMWSQHWFYWRRVGETSIQESLLVLHLFILQYGEITSLLLGGFLLLVQTLMLRFVIYDPCPCTIFHEEFVLISFPVLATVVRAAVDLINVSCLLFLLIISQVSWFMAPIMFSMET